MARPGKYEKWLTDESLATIENWAASGITYNEMARLIGVASVTFREWRDKFPAFSAAIKKGQAKRADNIENTLHDVALGYCTEETKVIDVEEAWNGDRWVPIRQKKRITTRKIPPNTAALIFEAKNRCGYSDNPNQNDADTAEAEDFLKAWRDA